MKWKHVFVILLVAATTPRAVASRHAVSRSVDAPFDVVIDVNGTVHILQMPRSHVKLVGTVGQGELTSFQLSRSNGLPRWSSRGYAMLSEEIDGARIRLEIFPIRQGLSPRDRRIFAKSWIDFNDDWELQRTIERFGDFNVAVSGGTVTRVGDRDWQLSGVNGPRLLFDDPIPLFVGEVGGRSFDITIRELGFGQFDAAFHQVPEPGTLTLLGICGASMAVAARIKRHRDVRAENGITS